MSGALQLESSPRRGSRSRVKLLVGRFALPGVLAIGMFIGAAAYAFFAGSGSGTGTATVGSLAAPLVDPAGEPAFSLTHMVPGDTSTRTATVTATGGPPSHMFVYEQGLTGTLVSQLSLKIVEDGSTVLYNGPLTNGPTSGSPLALPGTGAGGSWPAAEQHHFDFTVSFASAAGNGFQSANASVSFVWQRELP